MREWVIDIFLLILKLIFGSVKELKNELRNVQKNLHSYARQISNPGIMSHADIEQASCAIRQNASNFISLLEEVKCLSFLAFLHIIPEKNNILRASMFLINISNSLTLNDLNDGMRNCETTDEIKKLLLIKPDLCERFSSWIVFILVAIGGYSLVNFIASLIQKLIGNYYE